MKISGDVKEVLGFSLAGIGVFGGTFLCIVVWTILPENYTWLVKGIFSVMSSVIFAAILIGAGAVLVAKKYNQFYYDQRMKGRTK